MGKKRKIRKRVRRKPFLYVREVKHGWLRREIHLAGEVEAVIDYDYRTELVGVPRGYEPGSQELPPPSQGFVRANGMDIGPLLRSGWTRKGWEWAVRFELKSGEDAFPAEVRAELGGLGLLRIRWLSLVVARVTLYEERDGKTVVLQARSDFPLPAAPGDATGEGLPIPSEAGGRES